MNVLLLTQLFSTTKGGSEYVFSLMAKLLADCGNNVWVITNRTGDEEYHGHKNIKVIFIPPSLQYKGGHPSGFKDNMTYSWHAFAKGLSIIREENIDIIHSNSFAAALPGSMLSLLTSKPHVIYIQDIFSLFKDFWKLWAKENNLSPMHVLFAPILEKLLTKLKCSAIHTISETSKDDLIKFGTKKPIYIIDTAVYLNEHNNLKTNPFQFFYLGRLVFYKNLEVVIKAVLIVKRFYPHVTLVIAGDGPYKKSLIRLVNELKLQENIEFKGHVSDEEKKRLLSESQALVLPSLCEGFGIVILEAFSFAKPVIISNVPPLPDMVSGKNTGLVISPHDESEWAKAIVKMIEEPSEGRQMGLAGRQLLKARYNTRIMRDQILEMYGNLKQKSNR